MKSNLPLIFYADDDAAFLHLFQLGLSEEGPDYQIKCFADGEALLQSMSKLAEQFGLRPHLVLLDQNMPVKDGLSTLKELKAHPEFRDIPVFIISDTDDKVLQGIFLDQGAEAFITKPMAFSGIQDVLAKIDAHLAEVNRSVE